MASGKYDHYRVNSVEVLWEKKNAKQIKSYYLHYFYSRNMDKINHQ